MWKRGRRVGFILAEQLLALAVLALAAGALVVGIDQFTWVRQQNEQRLVAARLVKEASDQLLTGDSRVTLYRAGVTVVATRSGIRATSAGRCLITIGGD